MSTTIVKSSRKPPKGKMFIDYEHFPGLSTGSPSWNKQAGAGKKRKPRKKNKKQAQAGGFPLAPILAGVAATHAGLEKFKPFSKAKKALEENVSEKHKNNILYKLAHKISGVGSAFGYGHQKKR